MAKELNVAVLGLGMGMHHCTAIVNARGARLYAVCDHDEARLNAAVADFGCKSYAQWPALLKDDAVDVICIATESGTHTEFALQAARAGKHLLIEKPLDVTPARIRRMEAGIKKAGVTAGCVFQLRVDPCNAALKKAIDKGTLGRILSVHGSLPWFRADEYYAGAHGSWKGTWKLDGGGSLMNQGIHTLDLLQWFGGPVESVCGYHGVFNHDIEAEDQAVAILKFANGALGTLFTSTCCVPENSQRLQVFGTRGSFSKHAGILEFFEAGTARQREKMLADFGGGAEVDTAGKDPLALASEGHRILIEDLVKAIREGREPMIPVSRGKHAVEIANAIYRSGNTGREVKIAQVRK